MSDIDISTSILLDEDGSNITLDLNGHKIKYSNKDQPLFNITKGATLTVKDNKQAAMDIPTGDKFVCQDNSLSKNGNPASMTYDNSNIPTNLTYYVTGSSVKADGTSTTETLYKHETSIGGAIVACADKDNLNHDYLKLINLYATDNKGGTFKLESGVITQQKNISVNSLVYAENGSTVNMSGGYVCGATSNSRGAGIELGVKNGKGATLNLTGGVIAGNCAPEGGGVYADGSTINMTGDTTGGTISGNGTFEDRSGFGAGICAKDSMVTILNGYITNNRYQHYVDQEGNTKHLGNGCHGGGGIAAFSQSEGQKIGSLVISGGYITGNYSAEAGGGVYAGAWNKPLSRFTFSDGTIASNVAEHSEGGGIRISAPTVGEFNVSGKKAYITNNTTNTTYDWGGGGVFVQGGGDNNVQPASLEIYNALITNNHANGFGGGFAACPTGKTAITDTNGIAIFGNSDGRPDGSGYNRSGGGHGKNDDADRLPNDERGEITEDFKKAGHQDLFLIRDRNNGEYIAAVTGQMLGGGAANWSGTIDNNTSTFIGKYEGAQAKYMIGLKSEPIQYDKDAAAAAASLFITGNRSNIHGGGVMTNGNVIAGSTTQVSVYPKMKLNGIKALTGRKLDAREFKFQLLKPGKGGKAPSFNDGKLQLNDCSVVDTVENDENGNFTFDLGEVYADDALVYYLVEVPGTDEGVDYDKTIYKIDPEVEKDENKSHDVLDIKYTYYKVTNVSVTRVENDGAGARTPETEPAAIAAAEGEDAFIVKLTSGATFTNKFTPYTSSGSWTPKATKVVEGGEMKEFTLQLATDKEFTNIVQNKSTKTDAGKSQTLSFDEIKYELKDLEKLASDSTGRGASNTFTYYVREQQPTTSFTNYTYDRSVYQITVNAVDDSNHKINISATYKQIQDRDGNEVTDGTNHALTDTSTPTFTNTYSTTLPLSGMSGVTLTYLAGAAVLCAAAAWMHIRRKANAKGGERRE